MQGVRLHLALDANGVMLLLGTMVLYSVVHTLVGDCARRFSVRRVKKRTLQRTNCGAIDIPATPTITRTQSTQGIDPHHGQLRDLVGYQRLTTWIRGGGRFVV